MFTFCVAEAIWNSLNADGNLCWSMQEFCRASRDYPMMLDEPIRFSIEGGHRSGNSQGKVREFYFVFGKIDILKNS